MGLIWEDERYVRLYTRDTPTWLLMPWQSRCLIPLVMRKLNRVGFVDLGPECWEALAALILMPLEVVMEGMPPLLKRGVFVLGDDNRLMMPNFLPAQEARQSDKARKAAERERARARALLVVPAVPTAAQAVGSESTSPVTDVAPAPAPAPVRQPQPAPETASRNVTDGHEMGRSVTESHKASLLAEPSRAVPSSDTYAPTTSTPVTNRDEPSRSVTPPEPAPDAARRGTHRPDLAIPFPGSPERGVYDVLVADPQLAPIVSHPSELAHRLCDQQAYPALDALAEVKLAANWLAANPKRRKKNGASFLINWFSSQQERGGRRPSANGGTDARKGMKRDAPSAAFAGFGPTGEQWADLERRARGGQ